MHLTNSYRPTRAEAVALLRALADRAEEQRMMLGPDDLPWVLRELATMLVARDDDWIAWRMSMHLANASEAYGMPEMWDGALHETPDAILQMIDTEAIQEFRQTAPRGRCVGALTTFQEHLDGTFHIVSSRLPVLVEHLTPRDARNMRITRPGPGQLWARVTATVSAYGLWCAHLGVADDEGAVLDMPEMLGNGAVVIERGKRYAMDDVDLTLWVDETLTRPPIVMASDPMRPSDGETRYRATGRYDEKERDRDGE